MPAGGTRDDGNTGIFHHLFAADLGAHCLDGLPARDR